MTKYRYTVKWDQESRHWDWWVFSDEPLTDWARYKSSQHPALAEFDVNSGKSLFRWLAIRRAKNVIVHQGLAAKEAREKSQLNVDREVEL